MLCRISLLLFAAGLAAATKRATYYPHLYAAPEPYIYSEPSYYYEPSSPSVYPGYPIYSNPIPPLTAVVDIKNYGGDEVNGRIMFTQIPGGPVLMKGNITGLSEGAHGFHIHEFGDLANGCDSLGAHYNPTLSHHGGPADPYRHVGDLGNLQADSSGLAKISETDHLISLTGPHSIIGRGLVIHAQKDDFGRGGDKESLRTGNSGPRVACGVVAWAVPPHLQPPKPMEPPKESDAEAIEP